MQNNRTSDLGTDRSTSFELAVKKENLAWVLLVFVIAAGFLVRIYRIGWLSLWVDEGFSDWAAQHSLSYIWTVLPKYESNPPLYYTLLKVWRSFFGDSEAVLRALSALINTATIPLLFLAGRGLAGKKSGGYVGLLASSLFALSTIQIRYAQEARGYALVTFGVGISVCAALWIIRNSESAARSGAVSGERFSRRMVLAGLALGLGLATAMWSHFTGIFAAAAILISLLYWWSAETRFNANLLKSLLPGVALWLALILPNFVYLLGRTKDVHETFWLREPGISTVTQAAVDIFGATTGEGFAVLTILMAAATIGFQALWSGRNRSAALLLASVVLLPWVFELVISFLSFPLFLERTLVYSSVPFFLLAAYGAMTATERLRAPLTVALLIVLAIPIGSHFREMKKEPWDEVTTYVARMVGPDQPVFYCNVSAGWVLGYYQKKRDARFVAYGVPTTWPSPDYEGLDRVRRLDQVRVTPSDVDRVLATAKGNDRIGLILRFPEVTDPQGLLLKGIRENYSLIDRKDLYDVSVLIFQKR
jgi:uncharacterized membrane protein